MFVLRLGLWALYHMDGAPYLVDPDNVRRSLDAKPTTPSDFVIAREWLDAIDEYCASRRVDSNSKERFVRESFTAATKAADMLRAHLRTQEAS